MNRTTVYLPDDLRVAVEREASRRAVPQAEVIRLAIRELTSDQRRPRHGGIIQGGQAIAEHVDEYLAGFGR